MGTTLCHGGTNTFPNGLSRPFYPLQCGYLPSVRHCKGMVVRFSSGGVQVESNQRYYRRRAVEERMAAQRAVTETARAWHSKLAEDFAERASAYAVAICE